MSESSQAANPGLPSLRNLPLFAKLGVFGMILVIAGGMAASALVIFNHYEKRDEQPGLSMADIKGAYHGTTAPAALRSALDRKHPPELEAASRDQLLAWLNSDKIAENYENFDMGPPSEIIASSCLQCHARSKSATQPVAANMPLERWDDVRKVAFPVNIRPADPKHLLLSTHAHTLTLAMLALVLSGLLAMTTCSKGLRSFICGAMGVSLAADLGSWWLARSSEFFVYFIVAGGAIFSLCVGLACLLIVLELMKPRR